MKQDDAGSRGKNIHSFVTTQPAAQVKHHNTGEYRNTPSFSPPFRNNI